MTKEADGKCGETDANPVMEAVKNIRAKFPDLTIACDVCLCPYTSHGHCGLLREGMNHLDDMMVFSGIDGLTKNHSRLGQETSNNVVTTLNHCRTVA